MYQAQTGEQVLAHRIAQRDAQLGLASVGTTLAPGRIYWRVSGHVTHDDGNGKAEGHTISVDYANHRDALIAQNAIARFGYMTNVTEHELL